MLWQALSAARDIGRVHDIAAVLIRYGFGDLVRRIGMAGALERTGRALHWGAAEELARLEPPARMRRILEELGPTFVKLGQILETRSDLFPPEWITEFGKLQDDAPALPFEALRNQLCEDLGAPPEQVFASLDTRPLAAASLAQTHRATLADGRAVILKVRRPGIRPVVEADLRLLARLADIIDAEAPDLRRYRPREVVHQFTQSLRRELDFTAEGRNAERIAANFAAQPRIRVPRIHWQWSGERLNVQEYIAGIPGRDLPAVDAAGLDRRQLARLGAAAVLQMTLEDGFFHADMHPGNVFYLPDNGIALIDFGMVGRLSEERRLQVALLLHGLVSRDAERVTEILLDWSHSNETEPDALRADLDAFVDEYHGIPLKRLNLGAMLADLVSLLRYNGLVLPPDLALLVKAFISLEGMGRQLDPDFDMTREAAPYLERMLLARYAPAALAQRGWRLAANALDLLTGLPRDLSQLLRTARRGKLQIHIDVTSLKQFGDQLDRAVSRLTMGIVTAALIIGSAIALALGREADSAGLPAIALLGFLGAVIAGLWVLFSIWRSGKG